MVAGMLMPLRDLRAIYEILFRDGVMVAKKDKRPQVKHPEIQDVSNLQVIRAMGSLKSRGFVKETFAWRHFYWYLTNEGIVYLRDFLKLPSEIVPASLQRVRKPTSTFAFAQRAARVQTVEGPTSYVPKPGRRVDAESKDALAERQVYRRRVMESGESHAYFDKTPRFRGRPIGADAKPSLEIEDNSQSLFTNGFNTETSRFAKVFQQQPSASGDRPREQMIVQIEKATSSAQFNNSIASQDVSKSGVPSVSALPLTAAATSGAVALKVLVEASPPKTNTDKPMKTTEEKAWRKINEQGTRSFEIQVQKEQRNEVSVEQNMSIEAKAPAQSSTNTVMGKAPGQKAITKRGIREAGITTETTSLWTKPAANKTIIESKITQRTTQMPDQVTGSDTSKPVMCTDGVQIPQKAKGAEAEQTGTVADSATFAVPTVNSNLATNAPAKMSKPVQGDGVITELTKEESVEHSVRANEKSPGMIVKPTEQEYYAITAKPVAETSSKSNKKKKNEKSTSPTSESLHDMNLNVPKKKINKEGPTEEKNITQLSTGIKPLNQQHGVRSDSDKEQIKSVSGKSSGKSTRDETKEIVPHISATIKDAKMSPTDPELKLHVNKEETVQKITCDVQGSLNQKTHTAPPPVIQELHTTVLDEQTISNQTETKTIIDQTPAAQVHDEMSSSDGQANQESAVSSKAKRKKKKAMNELPTNSENKAETKQADIPVLSAPKYENKDTSDKGEVDQAEAFKIKETSNKIIQEVIMKTGFASESSAVPPVESKGMTSVTQMKQGKLVTVQKVTKVHEERTIALPETQEPVSIKPMETSVTQQAETEKVIPPVIKEQTPEALKVTAHDPTPQSDSQQETAGSSKSKRKKSSKDTSPEIKIDTKQENSKEQEANTSENVIVTEKTTVSKTINVAPKEKTVSKNDDMEPEKPEIVEKTITEKIITQVKLIQQSEVTEIPNEELPSTENITMETFNLDVVKAGKRKHPRKDRRNERKIILYSPSDEMDQEQIQTAFTQISSCPQGAISPTSDVTATEKIDTDVVHDGKESYEKQEESMQESEHKQEFVKTKTQELVKDDISVKKTLEVHIDVPSTITNDEKDMSKKDSMDDLIKPDEKDEMGNAQIKIVTNKTTEIASSTTTKPQAEPPLDTHAAKEMAESQITVKEPENTTVSEEVNVEITEETRKPGDKFPVTTCPEELPEHKPFVENSLHVQTTDMIPLDSKDEKSSEEVIKEAETEGANINQPVPTSLPVDKVKHPVKHVTFKEEIKTISDVSDGNVTTAGSSTAQPGDSDTAPVENKITVSTTSQGPSSAKEEGVHTTEIVTLQKIVEVAQDQLSAKDRPFVSPLETWEQGRDGTTGEKTRNDEKVISTDEKVPDNMEVTAQEINEVDENEKVFESSSKSKRKKKKSASRTSKDTSPENKQNAEIDIKQTDISAVAISKTNQEPSEIKTTEVTLDKTVTLQKTTNIDQNTPDLLKSLPNNQEQVSIQSTAKIPIAQQPEKVIPPVIKEITPEALKATAQEHGPVAASESQLEGPMSSKPKRKKKKSESETPQDSSENKEKINQQTFSEMDHENIVISVKSAPADSNNEGIKLSETIKTIDSNAKPIKDISKENETAFGSSALPQIEYKDTTSVVENITSLEPTSPKEKAVSKIKHEQPETSVAELKSETVQKIAKVEIIHEGLMPELKSSDGQLYTKQTVTDVIQTTITDEVNINVKETKSKRKKKKEEKSESPKDTSPEIKPAERDETKTSKETTPTAPEMSTEMIDVIENTHSICPSSSLPYKTSLESVTSKKTGEEKREPVQKITQVEIKQEIHGIRSLPNTEGAQADKVIPPVKEMHPETLKGTVHESSPAVASESHQEAPISSKSRRKKNKSESEMPKDSSPENKAEAKHELAQKITDGKTANAVLSTMPDTDKKQVNQSETLDMTESDDKPVKGIIKQNETAPKISAAPQVESLVTTNITEETTVSKTTLEPTSPSKKTVTNTEVAQIELKKTQLKTVTVQKITKVEFIQETPDLQQDTQGPVTDASTVETSVTKQTEEVIIPTRETKSKRKKKKSVSELPGDRGLEIKPTTEEETHTEGKTITSTAAPLSPPTAGEPKTEMMTKSESVCPSSTAPPVEPVQDAQNINASKTDKEPASPKDNFENVVVEKIVSITRSEKTIKVESVVEMTDKEQASDSKHEKSQVEIKTQAPDSSFKSKSKNKSPVHKQCSTEAIADMKDKNLKDTQDTVEEITNIQPTKTEIPQECSVTLPETTQVGKPTPDPTQTLKLAAPVKKDEKSLEGPEELITETEQDMTGPSSKSKRKKKKSPTTEHPPDIRKENITGIPSQDKNIIQTSGGPADKRSPESKPSHDKGQIIEISKETSDKPVKEISIVALGESVAQGPAIKPKELANLAQKTEIEKSSRPEEVKKTLSESETVTMHKKTHIEITEQTQEPAIEPKSPISPVKTTLELGKSKRKGKGKKPAAAQLSETINTEPGLLPEAEPLASTQGTDPTKVTVRDDPVVTSEVTESNAGPKMTAERMHSEETVQAAAVLPEAPADKREVEPALPRAEKRMQRAPKAKTSSTEKGESRELASEATALTTAQAAASQARDSPLHPHSEPPIVAQQQWSTQAAERSTEESHASSKSLPHIQETKKKLVKDTPSATTTPAVSQIQLGEPTYSIFCETDESNMRRKIVVVEEIVEVKRLVSPDAAVGGQSPPPPVACEEDEEDELDLDVLEEIAIERSLLQGGPPPSFPGAAEGDWDHSLVDPEDKTFNFVEDERDRVQKKTFTKWVNKHLINAHRHVTDLYEDLRDGHNLISLLEVLSGETLPREKGRMRFHKLQNVQIALDFLRHRQVKLVNIRNDDIADGNPKLTLGLIWTIILHFQISDIQVNGQSEDMSAKEKLLLWSQKMTDGYQGIRCDNFTTSWRDGKLFNAVIHKHYPRLIDMGKVYRQSNLENLEQAFGVAERDLGVTRLLDPEDVDVPHPDEKSIITYVSSLYDVMPRIDVTDGVRSNDLELRWQEYYELVTLLLQWIRHHVVIFEEKKFPTSYEEIELLWRQFLKFKETELPVKETDKNHSKQIYQTFESAVHAGQVKVPPGYHPIDVEKEWGRLHVAILERERLLRIEFERLERLQRIFTKVQMESGVCDDQLTHLEALLQKDIHLLNAGKPAQHTAEVERELDKADNMIRLLFNDVQFLKDGRHPQAEQMYRRVYRIHERLVNLRSDYNLRLKATPPVVQTVQSVTTKARPELDDVTLRYVQDLLAWVEDNQRRIDEAEWGSDQPSVESQLGSHRGLHQTVEDFKAKIERAKTDENQLSPMSKGTYKDYLGKLDLQYGKLLNSSKSRLRNLDSLHAFVSAATKELMWLNDKEEEEVNYDWSDRNTNMTAKKDNYSGLMRELEHREKKVNDIQAMGDKLVRDNHPGKKTVEAFTAALQTQWSWLLQLCCCIEAHLKENTAYYQFFADVKEAQDKMTKTQENMKKKYSCDRNTTATRLEDLLQDAVEEREQLNELKTMVTGLNKRAKTIIQLKPRNPTTPIKGKLPIQAVCDFKQQEITVHKGDECALLNNSQPFKWKVLNRTGNESVVPSVCFMVPPINKEALDSVASLDGGQQQMVLMWQKYYIDMKSLLSWQYLMKDFTQINSWNITMLKSMKPEEYRLVMRNLELHYQDFMRDSQDSQMFRPDDRMQVEQDYAKTTQHFENLIRSMEKGQQDETMCKNYISELKDLRMHIEDCENSTVARIRKPVESEPLKDCLQKTTEQKKVQVELDGLKKDLDKVSVKTQQVLNSPQPSASAPVLRSELDLTVQKMDHAHMLSSVYLEKLKTVEMVIRNTQGAEGILKQYEDCLREVHTVPSDVKEVESYRAKLKKMRAEAEAEQPVFDSLDEELKKASVVSDKMSRVHSERDVELDHYRQLLSTLQERWKAVFTQIDLRQRDLEQLGRQLGYYRENYDWLIRWINEAKQRQERIQAIPITDTKTLRDQLAQEKKLLEEIENNKDKVDECQKYAKSYIDTIKDYELQLVAYKAQVEPLTSSPLKKTKLDSASDNIIQEYVTLRTRYSELMTLTSQYIKFLNDTERRLEDEEKAAEKLKAEEKKKMAEMQAELDKQKQLADAQAKAIAKAEKEANELKLRMQEEVSKREIAAVDAQRQKSNIQLELHELKNLSEQQINDKAQQVEEALQSRAKIEEEIHLIRIQLETTVTQKMIAESELKQLRDKADEAEKLRKAAQDEAEKLRRQVNEETQKKRLAEEELKRKSDAEKEAARHKQKALEDLENLRMQAEEAERRVKQAEIEKNRQIQVAHAAAQKSAAAELQSKHLSFVEKTSKLEESLKQEHGAVLQLQQEAARLQKQQADAENAREEAERELEKWRQKANEALRLRLQAEEEAHKKTIAQEDAEKQKEDAEREAKKRAKAEESALKQKDMAEKELERQRKFADSTAQQKLNAEQELIRLRADYDNAEQQRSLLEDELYRLKNEVIRAEQQRKQLEDELAKVRSEMDVLIQMKFKAEQESMSNTERSKQLLEDKAAKMRDLADEASRLRAIAEEAKQQRQIAEEEAARQRSEAERILKEKLATISEATRLKTEAEIALKEKEAENERLRRQAEDEAYQRKALEDQANLHKQEIEEKIVLLKKSSDAEMERQKTLVDDTLKQKRIVEEEIRILKLNFEKASSGKLDLELELNKLKNIADETQQSKLRAEEEAEKLRKLALEEEMRRREAEERVKKIAAAEEEAARQRKAALEELERLRKKAEEARKQKDEADQEAERQLVAAQQAALKCTAAEHQVQTVLAQQKEDGAMQKKLKEEYEKARVLAKEAAEAKEKAEREAALFRQQAEEAERQKAAAEQEAANQAKAQENAEKLRKEAEFEAAKWAQAEASALKQKQQADAEMAKHKKLAEQTLKQKFQVEQELTKVKLKLDETDKQKSLLDDELQRLKDEVDDAVKQRSQVEEELFKVKVQMEELMKLKLRIEEENQRLIKKDKDNTQKLLAEEAENMKKLAEDAARLSIEAQETARLRQIAEEDLNQQRALADKMLKEKMLAIQEASRLKAEAEMLQRQKDLAQEQAQKLLEDKQLMQQRLNDETEEYQKSLEAERRRQLEILAEAEKLKLQVSQLSEAQARAEEEAKKFKKQADTIASRLHDTEITTREKNTVVEKLENERLNSSREAEDLRKAIADLEKEKARLKKEAEELQNKSKEMADAQQKQIEHEKTMLQQTFLTEKEMLLKKEKQIEDEKKRLESQFEEEVRKAQALKDEQERQKKQMEEEKKKLQANMDAALTKQKEAELEMLNKQKEMQELERMRLEQERKLAEENQKLREKLQQMEHAQKEQTNIETITVVETTRKVLNGQNASDITDAVDPLSFDGIREKVPAIRLHDIGLLPKKEFDRLKDGKTTVHELGESDNLKQILKGRNCIAGILSPTNQKMSIYQASKEKKITLGTAMILLEAQAATGFMIDPINNKKFSVNEAVKEGLIGPELHNKMVLAERAVAGYKDPYTGGKISTFEAMKKGLIEHDHAIRILEAQLATGGLIDPIHSHRVPTQLACKQGQYDAEMNRIMEKPSDDNKGYFDPSTQEPLTYTELMTRCKTDPDTGLLLLPITDQAAYCSSMYTEEETKDVFNKTTVSVPFGRFTGKTVTIWEIINSEYFTEDQKKDLLRQYRTGKITIEKIIKIVITVAEEKEKKSEITLDGIRGPVPAADLVESKVIDKDLYNKLHKGALTVKEVSEMEPVKKALKGTNGIAGVYIESSKQPMSFYQAMKKDMMRPGLALSMLEAQAGTGYITDPITNQKHTVDEAVKAGVVGPELHEKLLSAERAVTGYRDPYSGKTVSLFQAMKKDLIPKEQGIRLLDAQLTTGGIIDPVKSHRIPHDVACQRNYFDDETKQILTTPINEAKCFFNPNTKENVTYAQLFEKCITDKKTGLQLLPLSDEAIKCKEETAYTEAQTKEAMTQATTELDCGPFKGRKVTIWEIIHSEYFTEQERNDLLKQFMSGKITIEKLIKIIITIITEKEAKKQEQSAFKGLRANVPASSLYDSKIIDKPTFDLLQQGKTTPAEVSRNPNVSKYLQGSDCIAGIYNEPSKEKMSIYQAMKKKLLRHNTGLALLEAQAATGFIVDPLRNLCMSVDEAVKSGIVGPELHEKLLSAEKAVTGYKDPFTGKKISLFEAMQKDLILKEQALPMLEAQMVCGGIIDPVNSHRVPTDVAYQKTMFDQQTAKILSEPYDENKVFSNPENDESVTYKQLKDKCQKDPDTGLYMLPLSKPQSPTVVEKTYLYTEEQTQSDLSNTQIDIPIEGFSDKPMNLWDIMNSNLLPEQERQRLMDEYRSGKITKERMIIIIIEIMEQREIIRNDAPLSCTTIRRRITIEELYNAQIIDLETYNLLIQGKRDIRDIMELTSVKQYLYGTGCVAGVATDTCRMSIYQAMKRDFLTPEIALSLLEAQAATGFIVDPIKNETLTVDEAVRKGVVGPEIHDKLLSAERAVTGYKDPYSGKVISLFQAMKKDLVAQDYALKMLEAQTATGGIIDPEFQFHLPTDVAMQRGYINKETNEKLNDDVKGFIDPVTEEKVSYAELLKRCKLEGGLRLLSLGDKRLMFKGLRKQITIEELLRSQIIDQETVTQLNQGAVSVEEVSNRLSRYLEGTGCIAGVFLESSKERFSIYQAMKKNMIRPGTAFELLEAQAATGYVIDPIKNLKLTVNEAVKMGIVGPEFKDKLLSAERAVTGYRDPYSGKTISLFQAMKKGLILKDHGIRLLEAQIATGGIIDPEESHRLPVEVAYNRGFFDEEMNEILTDPSDDTKGFFDPNTEENLTYLQLMERCIKDPDSGLVLLLLKDKHRERKTSSKSSVRKRRVVIVDPETGKEMTVYEAYRRGLIDHQTYLELAEQECEWEEITMTSSDGTVKTLIIDRRSGRQYDVDDAIGRGLIDQRSLESYRSGNVSITEFADMLSGNMGGFRSRTSSIGSTSGSTSSYPMSPIPTIKAPAVIWNDPSEVTCPIAGILDVDTLEKISITEAMHRNLVDNITGQRLLEAQACTGGIIDPSSGERFSVSDATEKGLVDKIMVDRLNLAQKAFNGFEDPRTKSKMSASQALKKGWLYYEAGQRFLEVQYLTGGLIEPEVEGRVPLDESIRKGTIDARTAQKLRDVGTYSKYLTCPKTKLKISFKDAMDKSMVEEGSGLRLLEASSESTKGVYSPYNLSGTGSAYGSRSGSRTGSRTGSRRGSIDAGFTMNFSSSSYTSSSTSYGRRF
ncbi:plectin-like isoform X2 [Periophthalmus magnuspinnatus]|uniref:plectin-like isoform X2 n=1 Tax=Periophthalmus magnuspinnatus TaxID=409849 RepID=UPI00243663C4|nr:plectin-like isoform X2 [Periophthalmus magnuspinnatus]